MLNIFNLSFVGLYFKIIRSLNEINKSIVNLKLNYEKNRV